MLAERTAQLQERERLIAELGAKNAELERFTYTVSHDLKSPLFTIQGFLGLLRRDAAASDSDRMDQDMERITGAAQKMRRLLDDLLELSRVGRMVNPPEELSFCELAGEARDLVAGPIAERGVEVVIAADLPPEADRISADRSRLRQVLQNLIENAVKYPGYQELPRIEIGTRRDGEEKVFVVCDNGVGIAPEDREEVFGLFKQLDPKADSTGIGLALVKRIIEVHGGRIWVESEGLGQGSAFYFTLGDPDSPAFS